MSAEARERKTFDPERGRALLITSLALFVFFTSGSVALLDQVIWQRMLALFSGTDVYSVTIIVAAYMGGLGCGSLAGGHAADRLRRSTCLLLAALAEFGIGFFTLASKWLYYDVLYEKLGTVALAPGLLALVLFASLLVPTFLMGLSLPLLVRALTWRIEASAPTVSRLYAINTIGAGVGSLLTTWFLVRRLGLERSLELGAAVEILGACIVLGASLLLRRSERDVPPRPSGSKEWPHPVSAPPERFSLWAWLGLYSLSGFIALSLEIVWFRLLGIMVKSTAFTFGTLLAVYLVGLGLGTLCGQAGVRGAKRPVRTFLLLQTGIGLFAGLLLALLVAAVGEVGALAPLWRYFGEPEPIDTAGAMNAVTTLFSTGSPTSPEAFRLARKFGFLYFLLPALLIGPPTLLMGASFPYLQKAIQTDLSYLGRRVGWLQAANIGGSLLGAALTGAFLLSLLGTAGTLKLLVALTSVFAVLWVRSHRASSERPRALLLAVAVPVVGVAVLLPSGPTLWAKLHGTHSDRIRFVEDNSGLSLLKNMEEHPEGQVFVFAHGLAQSWIPYASIHSLLGALPAMLHPAPRDAAVIGLGSGDTLFHLGGRSEIVALTSVEIVGSQRKALTLLARDRSYPALRSVLHDPRIRFIEGDGRAYLRQSGHRFDIIEADALRPNSAFAGNLYSEEYFRLLRAHLKPGGMAVSWAPTGRVRTAFVKAFPHVLSFGDVIVGGNGEIPYYLPAIRARLEDPFTRAYYSQTGNDVAGLVLGFLEGHSPARFGPEHDRSKLVDTNTDLFPKDEYQVPEK